MPERAIAVVLCCALDDEPMLAPLVQTLQREGLNPEVLSGIEDEARKVAEAIDSNPDEPTVYVVCRTDNLSKAAQRRVEGLFSARRGPSQGIVTVDLQTREEIAVLRQIRQSVADLIAQLKRNVVMKPEAGNDRVQLREVVEMTNISAVGQAEAPPLPVGMEPLDDTTQREFLPSKAKLPPRKPPPPEPEAVVGVASPTPAPSQGNNPVMLIVGVVAFGLAAIVLWVMLRGEQPVQPAAPGSAAGARRGAPEPTGPTPNADRHQGGTSEASEAGDSAAGGGHVGPGPEGTGGDAPQIGGSVNESDDGGESPPPADEALALANAIADGKLRALDDLLFVSQAQEDMAWRGAVDHCKFVAVNGVRGFDLATIKQLKRLRSARMLDGELIFWSSTVDTSKGDGQDHVRVVDNVAHKVLARHVEEQARPLCVRSR